jgi:hypothetical protein
MRSVLGLVAAVMAAAILKNHVAAAGDVMPQDSTRVLVLSPKAAESADTTHAALLMTRQRYSGRITFAGRVQTVKQIRVGSPPNPWECAWLVWHYQDEQHFYYVSVKPTGWEVGKRDPAYPGGQRFLASGIGSFPIGAWHDFLIRQDDNVITVSLNGIEIVSYVDAERAYLGGTLGLYAEDAEVQIDDITAPFADDFEGDTPMTVATDGVSIGPWVAPFLGYGHVAIADRAR